MTELHLNHLDDDIYQSLEERAASHGCSVEDELNSVLRDALSTETLAKANKLSPQERVAAFKATIARYGVAAPNLTDEAISREAIYGERG